MLRKAFSILITFSLFMLFGCSDEIKPDPTYLTMQTKVLFVPVLLPNNIYANFTYNSGRTGIIGAALDAARNNSMEAKYSMVYLQFPEILNPIMKSKLLKSLTNDFKNYTFIIATDSDIDKAMEELNLTSLPSDNKKLKEFCRQIANNYPDVNLIMIGKASYGVGSGVKPFTIGWVPFLEAYLKGVMYDYKNDKLVWKQGFTQFEWLNVSLDEVFANGGKFAISYYKADGFLLDKVISKYMTALMSAKQKQ